MSQNPYPDDVAGNPAGDAVGNAETIAQKDAALRMILDPDARSRLSNIRMVRPELAAGVENYLLGLASQGRAPSQITDSQLKQILVSIQQPRRDFKFSRV